MSATNPMPLWHRLFLCAFMLLVALPLSVIAFAIIGAASAAHSCAEGAFHVWRRD